MSDTAIDLAAPKTPLTVSDEIAIEIVGMNKWYGDFHVLRDIDPDAYNLGKTIFIGRANLNAMSPVGAQQAADTRRALDAVIALIPERASEQLDVAALSRALDAASREALIYYLKLRFRVKENTE